MTYITNLYGQVDTNNSTTSLLANGAIYTGTGTNVVQCSSISVSIMVDEPSIDNGLSLEFSPDNINWDVCKQYTIIKNKYRTFDFSIKAQYFRIVYTNNTIVQGVFRLQTILHYGNSSNQGETLGADKFVAEHTKGIIMGAVRNDDISSISSKNGYIVPLQVNKNGELRIDTIELINVRLLLEEMITQQKITNMHLSQLSDNEFVESDIV
jgi:hypothetical protein